MSSHNDSDGGRVIKLESKLKEAQVGGIIISSLLFCGAVMTSTVFSPPLFLFFSLPSSPRFDWFSYVLFPLCWCGLLQAELTEVERLFEENTRKLALLDAELDKAEERAEVAEKKVRVQEAELSAALVELKTLALHGEKASASDESANKKVKALGATLREVCEL